MALLLVTDFGKHPAGIGVFDRVSAQRKCCQIMISLGGLLYRSSAISNPIPHYDINLLL